MIRFETNTYFFLMQMKRALFPLPPPPHPTPVRSWDAHCWLFETKIIERNRLQTVRGTLG